MTWLEPPPGVQVLLEQTSTLELWRLRARYRRDMLEQDLELQLRVKGAVATRLMEWELNRRGVEVDETPWPEQLVERGLS